ncbi:acyl-protein thioesterase [Perkinsus olseni]|nr:acyl-protein thioesterase [Perkinsus olseni]
MSSELKTSGPLLLGLSRLHKLKVEVVETMAEGLIGRMLRNPTAANNWSGGGRGAAKSSKKRGRGGAPPLAPSLPAISEEADGWSEAETIDALRENARLLSPAMKAIMEHMTPSRSAPSPFSRGNTPLDDLLSAVVASNSSRRRSRRGSAMSSESPVRSVNLGGGGADDSAMDIDTLRGLAQQPPPSEFSFDDGGDAGGPPSSGRKRRRSSSTLSGRGVFDTTLEVGRDSSLASMPVTPAGDDDDGWEFRGLPPGVAPPPPTTRQVVARAAPRRRRRVTVGSSRAARNKGADVGGISLLPSRQKRNHRRRNGGMPDLTPDDVLGFISTHLRSVEEMQDGQDYEEDVMPVASQDLGHVCSPIGGGRPPLSEVSFMPPFTPDRRGSSVEEMQEEQDDPTLAVATPFTDLGMYDDLEVLWSPQERAPSVASGSPASVTRRVFPARHENRTDLKALFCRVAGSLVLRHCGPPWRCSGRSR